MPARPTSTVTTDVTSSSVLDGSATASVGVTYWSQWVSGSQCGENCSQPPKVARTASTPTGTSIVHGPSPKRPCLWWCSRTNALGSPGKTRNQSRNVYRPVRNAPAMPQSQKTQPYQVPSAPAEAMIGSFEKKPLNGGIPTSASAPARKHHF